MDREGLLALAREQYGDEPRYLWADTPDACVLRHGEAGKWYAVVMRVPRARLGLEGEGAADIVNVKCAPVLAGSFLGRPGYLPAYHMNKEHWLSCLLDGSAPDGEIAMLLGLSRELTI